MKRERERLVKVTSEAELRVGMIVVVKRCPYCRGRHRMMLIWSDGFGHRVMPTPRCWPKDHDALSTPKAIREGRLYRVVDGLDPAKEAKRDRELERVR